MKKYTLLAVNSYDGLVKLRNNLENTVEWVDEVFLFKFSHLIEGI